MRRTRILGVTGIVGAAAVVTAMSWWGHSPVPEAASATTSATAPARSTVAVVRGNLTSEHDFTGAVTFGDSWSLPLQLAGIVTASQPAGAVVDFGEELVRVNDEPVFLGRGTTPMYRRLELTRPHLSGDDVRQLQSFLIDTGFDADGQLEADGEFGALTKSAVKSWQEAVGLPKTGAVDGTQLIFSPTPLRIESTPRVGTIFDGIAVTGSVATVTVDISASQRAELPVDGAVTVEPADGSSRDGTVTSQDRVIKADGSTGWRATIDVGELGGDDASVLVHSVVVEAANVLIVPTSALLAVAEGGFAVEMSDGNGTHLVQVDVGTVVDAQAEITGEVQPGDEVVVPE